MLHENLLRQAKPEDFTGDLGLIVQECGLEVAVSLVVKFGGTQLNIPKYGLKQTVERYVRSHYNGTNAKTLALQCGITERQVFKIVEAGSTKGDQYSLVGN
jgi:Mor family transcriptional regulator